MPPLGIMVETPAAAVAIDLIPADFYSIGSNDLTQYVMAASRDAGGRVAALNDPLHPAVLRLIGQVVRHGAATGMPVSLCGDMASDPRAVRRPAGPRPAPALGGAGGARPGQAGRGAVRRGRCLSAGPPAGPRSSPATRSLLRSFIERRPSGLRGRLAMALGKHKSFVSQIANPAYAVPIPAGDLPIIFEICHLSAAGARALPRPLPRAPTPSARGACRGPGPRSARAAHRRAGVPLAPPPRARSRR